MDYVAGADLPDLQLTWYDGSGAVIDFSSGYTFTVKVAPLSTTTATVTKTSNVSGSASAPNVTIAWATNEIGSLPTGTYDVQVKATRTSDGKDRFFPGQVRITVKAAIQ